MRSAVPILIEDEDIAYLDRLSRALAKQRNTGASRSEAVAWLIGKHRKKMLKKPPLDPGACGITQDVV